MGRILPFTRLEALTHHLDRRRHPLNMQGELASTATVDVDRLAVALQQAMRQHPMARARRQPASPGTSRLRWGISDDPGPPPIHVVDAADHDLRELRNRLYGRRFDLSEGPPFTVVVQRGGGIDGGDRVLQSVSHVAADGVGMLRLGHATWSAYRDAEPLPSTVSLRESRSLLEDLRATSLSDAREAAGTVARRLREGVLAPSDIARDGGSARSGWGYERRVLGPTPTGRLVEGRPDGVSVNDVLLAALHLTIQAWNDAHGEPTGWLGVMMPVNVRPEAWFYDVMAMYTLFERIRTDRGARRIPRAAVASVARQTTHITEQNLAAGAYEALSLLPDLPVGLERHLPDLLAGPGGRLLDTAVLTNLGRVPVSPSLGAGSTERVWFSPPTWPSLPVGIAVGTFDGELHLFCRYRLTQFDAAAAGRFLDSYVARVGRLVETTLPEMTSPTA
jgi:NRPS condensation-like uncharacterized protein